MWTAIRLSGILERPVPGDRVKVPSRISDVVNLHTDAEQESQLQSGARPKRYEDVGLPPEPTQVGSSSCNHPRGVAEVYEV